MGIKTKAVFQRFSTSFPSRPTTTTTSRMALSASRGVMRGLVARGRQFCTSRSSKAVIDAEARKANFDRSAVHPVYFKLKEKQAAMKGGMNVPVHLKGGSKDRVLFNFTVALALYCFANTLSTIYTMSYPPKKE